MARLRTHKKLLRNLLEDDNWQNNLSQIISMNPREAMGPLLSFLLLGGETMHRSALAIGLCMEKLCQEKKEDARNIVRRFMWHMNEESGNIGWGIPEAFAETLVHSQALAKEFHPVLLSYIMDTGRDDNFCDHAILRRSCFWAVGHFAAARPEYCTRLMPWLLRGLQDEDLLCRGLAAWAFTKLPQSLLSPLDTVPLLRRLTNAEQEVLQTKCVIFESNTLQEHSIKALAENALKYLGD